mmetsp:Transcript_67451/g.149442  ORF Transcript_67451/g.149442 Transcript_67451/m.149442 type:complete len:211 (+) Transcript_67451:253-885(+)
MSWWILRSAHQLQMTRAGRSLVRCRRIQSLGREMFNLGLFGQVDGMPSGPRVRGEEKAMLEPLATILIVLVRAKDRPLGPMTLRRAQMPTLTSAQRKALPRTLAKDVDLEIQAGTCASIAGPSAKLYHRAVADTMWRPHLAHLPPERGTASIVEAASYHMPSFVPNVATEWARQWNLSQVVVQKPLCPAGLQVLLTTFEKRRERQAPSKA